MEKLIEKFRYRPEVDGLRAIAVIAVVLVLEALSRSVSDDARDGRFLPGDSFMALRRDSVPQKDRLSNTTGDLQRLHKVSGAAPLCGSQQQTVLDRNTFLRRVRV
jgi:hypothetical protein